MANGNENSKLTNILLPHEWILYLYDKQLFKKVVNRANFHAKPYHEVCTIKTVNDVMYIIKLMGCKALKNKMDDSDNKINLDMNDYIIMRKGIEPIWEDPKNCNGGTFTIKVDHHKGYELWELFILYMMGETLTYEMEFINGITVSYIADYTNPVELNYTYIKIWDGKPERNKNQFLKCLPISIYDKIKNESTMYSQNNKKKDFGENIISKIKPKNKKKGGFIKHY